MIDGSLMHEDALSISALVERTVPIWGASLSQSTADAEPYDAPAMTLVRVILVDDQGMVRRGLRRELRFETDLEVVGEASNAEAGLALAQEQRPDIVIMDVEMPVLEGIDAAERLHALAPDCLIMLLATRYNVDVHVRGKAAGARVVMEKDNPEVFRNTFHDLVQFVKARNMPAWPDIGAADAQEGEASVIDEESDRSSQISPD